MREVTDLANNAPQYVQDAQDFVNKNKTLRKLDREYNIGDELQRKAKELPNHLSDAASVLSSVGGTIVSSLFAGIKIFILTVFMVAGGRRWIDWGVAQARPEHAPRITRALDRIGVAVGNYVGGALLQATIAGITTFIVLTILGVPFAAPLAVVVGFFDLIPLVGATIAAVLVGVVTVFHNFPVATIVWVVWAIVYQQVENYGDPAADPAARRRDAPVHGARLGALRRDALRHRRRAARDPGRRLDPDRAPRVVGLPAGGQGGDAAAHRRRSPGRQQQRGWTCRRAWTSLRRRRGGGSGFASRVAGRLPAPAIRGR